MAERAHEIEPASGGFGRWPKPLECWLGIALALFVATSLCYPSSELFARKEHRREAVQHQIAIATRVPMQINGQPGDIPEYRSRVLVPFVLLSMREASLLKNDVDRFMAVRLISAAIFFLLAYVFAFRVVRGALFEALAFIGILAIWLVISFSAAWEIPTEFPELTLLLLAVWAAIARHRVALLIVTAVAALNRESAMYYSVLWFCLWAYERRSVHVREAAFACLLGVVAFGETLFLRSQFRLSNGALANHVMLGSNVRATLSALANLPSPTWIVPLVTGTASIGIMILMSRSRRDRVNRAMVLTAAIISLPSFVIANIAEIRVFLPSVLLAVAAVIRQPPSNAEAD